MADGRLTCAFYERTGTCRYGAGCSKLHRAAAGSSAVMVSNLYFHPPLQGAPLSEAETQAFFDTVYQDWFMECSLNYGWVTDLMFCANVADHLLGNIYVSFKSPLSAQRCAEGLQSKNYAGRDIIADLCPVKHFGSAACREHGEGCCPRGPSCNLVHRIAPSRALERELFSEQEAYHLGKQQKNK